MELKEATTMEAISERISNGYRQHCITNKELMDEQERTRSLWVKEYGTEDGFYDWFHAQIGVGG